VHLIVGGCGRLGSDIAEQLSGNDDHDVVVVDVDRTAFDRLGGAFNGETVLGNVTDRDTLEQAGIARADGLLAVTRFDNANLMAVQIADHLYGVPRTVARLFNPERESVYRKLGVRYVSGTGILGKLFLNEFREDALPHHILLPDDEVEVVDLRLGPNAHGMTVEDFELDGRLRIAAVTRAERSRIPEPEDRLERGDVVTAAATRGVRRQLGRLLDEWEA
jgi:trk system potassium uptake protein TrkA